MRPHGCQGEYQPEPPHLGNAVLAWHGPLGRWEGRIPEAYPRGVENGPATWQAVVIQRKTPEQHMVMGHESIRGELDLLSLQELWQNCFGIPEKGAGCKQYGKAIARRRKEDRRRGIASRGTRER